MESEKYQLQNQNKTIDSRATDRIMPSYCMNNIPDAGLVDNWTVGQIVFLSSFLWQLEIFATYRIK